MKTRLLSAALMAALLALGLFAGPALAQEEEEFPEEVVLEEDEVLGDYVLDVVIVDEGEPEPEPRPEPEPEEEPEVEVLAEVQERLPVTGGDILGLSVIGLVLAGLGYFAVRRGRSGPTAEQG